MSLLAPLEQHSNHSKNITGPSWLDQFSRQNQRDLNLQVAVSVAFGLSAFISFCVSLQRKVVRYVLTKEGPAPQMDRTLRGTKKTVESSIPIARTAQVALRLDSCSVRYI